MVEKFFEEDKKEKEEITDECSQSREKGGRPRYRRMTDAEREHRQGRGNQDPDTDSDGIPERVKRKTLMDLVIRY